MAGWRNSELETLSSSAGAILTGESYYRDVARGKVSGAYAIAAYGKRISAGDSGVLCPNGDNVFPAAAGVQVTLASTDAQDGVGGTGIRSVEIHYLDANLVHQVEIVTLNGITGVTTTATDMRFIESMHLDTFGSGKAAVGTISATNGANTHAQIAAGQRISASSVRMVPAGKRLLVVGAVAGAISGAAASQCLIEIATTNFYGHDYLPDNVFIPTEELGFQDSSFGLVFPVPSVYNEGDAVAMQYSVDKAATITGTWFGIIEDAV